MAQLESTQKEKNTESTEQKTDKPQLSLSSGTSGQSPSQDYSNTMETLKESEYSLPEYTSSYDEQISQIYNKIVSREPFRYDPSSDTLYGNYREQYTQLGRKAMRDTMGQAAALTGGYGSSYAQQAGQQEYDSYLQKLGEVLPERPDADYNVTVDVFTGSVTDIQDAEEEWNSEIAEIQQNQQIHKHIQNLLAEPGQGKHH